jgi:hypothetical protein
MVPGSLAFCLKKREKIPHPNEDVSIGTTFEQQSVLMRCKSLDSRIILMHAAAQQPRQEGI